jgi:carbon storage regulator CsrA
MLVLARKVHESILIGEDQSSPHAMKVTILEIEARRVKLGFVMADDVRVERWEVWQRLQEETTPDVDAPIQPAAAGAFRKLWPLLRSRPVAHAVGPAELREEECDD